MPWKELFWLLKLAVWGNKIVRGEEKKKKRKKILSTIFIFSHLCIIIICYFIIFIIDSPLVVIIPFHTKLLVILYFGFKKLFLV